MADQAGQSLIRGVDIQTTAEVYALEASIFKNEVTVMSTPSREIRWYQKTSGFISLPSSSTALGGLAEGALPFVAEPSWTRNTSYVKKYMLDSPMISMEDESDSDVAVVMEAFKDVVYAVQNQVDADIWDVATESQSPVNINSVTSTAAWDAGSGQNPAEDIFEAEQDIREQTKAYPTSLKLYVSPKGYKDLKTWIVNQGSNLETAASEMVKNGNLVQFGGFPIVVSGNVTADYAALADLSQAVKYREFKGITTAIIEEPGIGKRARVWTHGVAILVKPKFVALISNTQS